MFFKVLNLFSQDFKALVSVDQSTGSAEKRFAAGTTPTFADQANAWGKFNRTTQAGRGSGVRASPTRRPAQRGTCSRCGAGLSGHAALCDDCLNMAVADPPVQESGRPAGPGDKARDSVPGKKLASSLIWQNPDVVSAFVGALEA